MKTLRLTKQNLKDIRKFAKEKIGGFGMWIELGLKQGYVGKEQELSYNMLYEWDKGTRDLFDFCDWSSLPTLDIDIICGFVWLDFYVHDKDELKDNMHVLINDKNEIIKMWRTWADEKELFELTKISTIH